VRKRRLESGLSEVPRRHGDTEAKEVLVQGRITEAIIGAAIEVHRYLGPGLLEMVYEECLCHELSLRGLAYDHQVKLPVTYKGVQLDCGDRIDVVVKTS